MKFDKKKIVLNNSIFYCLTTHEKIIFCRQKRKERKQLFRKNKRQKICKIGKQKSASFIVALNPEFVQKLLIK